MATLDEIFATMPDSPTGGTHELLIIDPDTRQIEVPEIESIFGVIRDGNAEKKYFQCHRYVGAGIDLAACKLRIAYQNASGTEDGRDGYLVQDLTESGGYVYFSWELSPKVCLYQGPVQFAVCAMLGDTVAWHTTLATGTVLEGMEHNGEIVQTEMQDVIAQLLALVEAQSKAVEAAGAAAVEKINAAAADTAPAIVCQAEGVTIQVADASDRPLRGLRIFGRSTQDGTPTPDNPVEIVSIPAPVVTITDGAEENAQTLTLANSLPGIPVASGGNYTDADGQQWICDEVDLGRGVYVRRIKRFVFNGAEKWEISDGLCPLAYISGAEFAHSSMCGMFSHGQYTSLSSSAGGSYAAKVYTNGILRIRLGHETSAEDFTAFVSEQHANGKPVTVAYAIATPIETPLSEAELAAFAALHSNKPNTTILNDSGAHMAVEYVADTKLYIDGKLAELVAAMNA